MPDTNCVPADVCAAKMTTFDERFRRDEQRLNKHDENLARLNEVSFKLDQVLAHYAEDTKEHNKRITTLEHRPGGLWDKLIGGIIGAVAGGLVAALMAVILK